MMEKITIITLVLTFITLIIVFFQTWLTKRSLVVAKDSIELTRKSLVVAKDSIELTKVSKQIERLPKMDSIIHVNLFLQKWYDELNKVIKYIDEKSDDKIKTISEKKRINKEGLIDRYEFEHMPNWLSIIYSSGAQYYYDSSCLYRCLWDDKNKKIEFDYEERLQDSAKALKILLKYIENEVPDVFLNCPASLKTNDFFEKTS